MVEGWFPVVVVGVWPLGLPVVGPPCGLPVVGPPCGFPVVGPVCVVVVAPPACGPPAPPDPPGWPGAEPPPDGCGAAAGLGAGAAGLAGAGADFLLSAQDAAGSRRGRQNATAANGNQGLRQTERVDMAVNPLENAEFRMPTGSTGRRKPSRRQTSLSCRDRSRFPCLPASPFLWADPTCQSPHPWTALP